MAKKVTSQTITTAQIEEVNVYLGYKFGSREISDYGYAFYYNQMQNGLDLCDADRYANLNTVLQYDVGIRKFRSLDSWLWNHNFDLMELTGSDADKELLQTATKATRTKELDYSRMKNFGKERYNYTYFESGRGHK